MRAVKWLREKAGSRMILGYPYKAYHAYPASTSHR